MKTFVGLFLSSAAFGVAVAAVYYVWSHGEWAWPILLAVSVLAILIGALWVPFLLFAGIAALLLIVWRMGAESNRIA